MRRAEKVPLPEFLDLPRALKQEMQLRRQRGGFRIPIETRQEWIVTGVFK